MITAMRFFIVLFCLAPSVDAWSFESTMELSGSSCQSGILGRDDRQIVRQQTLKKRTVRIRTGDTSCTASVVAPTLLLSAGHCLHVNGFLGVPQIEASNGKTYTIAGVAAPEFDGFPSPGNLGNEISDDVALIRTKEPIGMDLGWFGVSLNDDIEQIKLVGYHCDSFLQLKRQTCTAYAVDDYVSRDRIVHRCDAFSGSSGSPLLAPNGKVVGVQVGTKSDNKTPVEGIGALLGAHKKVRKWLMPAIASDIKKHSSGR